MSKLCESLRQAIERAEVRNGMTISFHHHLRNGDYVLNMVLEELEQMGIRDLTVNASSIFDCHAPLGRHIRRGVVTGLETGYLSEQVGRVVSEGALSKPVVFRTHGGRASDILEGRSHIDVAFLAVPACDEMGNSSGKYGPAACGSLGYAIADAQRADKVVAITDHIEPYPLGDASIGEELVDLVVKVDAIGDPAGIVSGTTRMPRDPVALKIADQAAEVIAASVFFREGFSFQTGAGGASLAVAAGIRERMLERKLQGSYALGGITGYTVDLLESGCFRAIQDVQCFDLRAVESLRKDTRHIEITAARYASPTAKSSAASNLDVVVLGATQIDVDFNVNVHTDSVGRIIGGSGGHTDVAEEAKLTVVVAPISRARMPVVVDKVLTVSTAGAAVDVLVTQYGVAVNPMRAELREKLKKSGLPVMDIRDLRAMTQQLNGPAAAYRPKKERVVAQVLDRRGEQADLIYQV